MSGEVGKFMGVFCGLCLNPWEVQCSGKGLVGGTQIVSHQIALVLGLLKVFFQEGVVPMST